LLFAIEELKINASSTSRIFVSINGALENIKPGRKTNAYNKTLEFICTL